MKVLSPLALFPSVHMPSARAFSPEASCPRDPINPSPVSQEEEGARPQTGHDVSSGLAALSWPWERRAPSSQTLHRSGMNFCPRVFAF